jgi:hypothetical protein
VSCGSNDIGEEDKELVEQGMSSAQHGSSGGVHIGDER